MEEEEGVYKGVTTFIRHYLQKGREGWEEREGGRTGRGGGTAGDIYKKTS